jgi:hypothetical protein
MAGPLSSFFPSRNPPAHRRDRHFEAQQHAARRPVSENARSGRGVLESENTAS